MLRPSAIRFAAAPLRVAIIGSGPSGFYSAARILSTADARSLSDVQVHMYERLPVPNGLVRYGVAPDHLEVKNVENRFGEIASDPRFRFFGNVNVTVKSPQPGPSRYLYPRAVQLPITNLAKYYTQILFAYGCSESRLLGIPGSNPGQLLNVHSALDFVNWYNGHPTAHDPEILAQEPWRKVDLTGLHKMSIIGAGNVALDVARIVLRSSSAGSGASAEAREALIKGDIPESVIHHLSQSRIADVDINARRGPAQVAFTNKELREMMALPGIAFNNVGPHLIKEAEQQVIAEEENFHEAGKEGTMDPDSAAEKAGQFRIKKRLLSLLTKGSKAKVDSADKRWTLNFFRAPAAFQSRGESGDGSPARIGSIKWTATYLGKGGHAVPLSDSAPSAPWGNATPSTSPPAPAPSVTSAEFETSTDAVVSSVGYRGTSLQEDALLETMPDSLPPPWDVRNGVICNREGRVIDAHASQVPGLYVAGWLARGPVGVIASTMHHAYMVSDLLMEDFTSSSHASASLLADANLKEPLPGLPAEIQQASSQGNKRVVEWKDWMRIDQVEKQRGQDLGKVREKVLTVKDMLRLVE